MCTRRWAGECVKSLGGAERSIMAMLWLELSSDSRRAVARPMPEEPPVITMVLGEPLRLLKAEASGWKREAILLVFDANRTGTVLRLPSSSCESNPEKVVLVEVVVRKAWS